jgi:hypothetical protein
MVVPAGIPPPAATAIPLNKPVVDATVILVAPVGADAVVVVLMALEIRQLAGKAVVPDMALKFSETGVASGMLIWAWAPEGQNAKSASSTATTRMLLGFMIFIVNLVSGQWVLPHTKIKNPCMNQSDQYWV